jgi:hypothetical protein
MKDQRFTVTMLLALVSSVLVGCLPAAAHGAETPTPALQEVGSAVTIKNVRVDADQISVSGTSALPDGTCILTSLRTGRQAREWWWPADVCATVHRGAWQIVVPLGKEGAPARLDPTLIYEVRAWQQGRPSTKVAFPFDLAGPPTPKPEH